jgi:hypothetical protein
MDASDPRETVKAQFARVYGNAGEAPRVLGLLRAFWPLLLICFLFGYLLRALLPFPLLSLSAWGFLLVLLSVSGVLLLAWGDRRLSNYLKGARGEESVGRELNFLSSDYAVFHGVHLPHGKENFDHIVIAPTGIYVIETKNWSGRVRFEQGEVIADEITLHRSPVKQVKEEVAELHSYLTERYTQGLPIQPVLCFLESELEEPIQNINGVVVCRAEQLMEVLSGALSEPIEEADRLAIEELLQPLVS